MWKCRKKSRVDPLILHYLLCPYYFYILFEINYIEWFKYISLKSIFNAFIYILKAGDGGKLIYKYEDVNSALKKCSFFELIARKFLIL